MANIKIIDLPTGSPESTSFIEATQVDELAESGRSSVKLALNALGNYVAGQGASPLEYGDLETESTTLIGGINELHDSIGADAYDETSTYAEGALCIYNNTLYACTVSGGITTPEAWTAAHWTATTIEALIAAKQNSFDANLDTTDQTIVGAINEHESELSQLTKVKSVTVYATNGARLWIKRLGDTVQVEVNEGSQMAFAATWSNLYTDNTYQTRAYLDSEFMGTANTLYVPIGLVNGHQIILKIEKVNGAIQMICDTASAIYPQGSGIYTLA